MTQQVIATQPIAGTFDSVAKADAAIRRLLGSGLSKDQLAVICPAKFTDHFSPHVSQAEAPSADTGTAVVTGGAIGATLGGLALAATALTGGFGAIAAAVFIGGGAIAGGFSNLISSKGYEHEADDHYKRAIERGEIVVAVEVEGEDGAGRLAEAQRILDEAGAKPIVGTRNTATV